MRHLALYAIADNLLDALLFGFEIRGTVDIGDGPDLIGQVRSSLRLQAGSRLNMTVVAAARVGLKKDPAAARI